MMAEDSEDFLDLDLDDGGDISASSSPVVIIDGDDERQLYEHFRFVADKGQALLRVDKFLVERLQKSSRNRVQQAAEAGCIWVNGKAVKSNYRVKPFDVIQVVMDRPRYEFEIVAQDIPLDIVYEDRYVLVVNKPAGMVVHPGNGNGRTRGCAHSFLREKSEEIGIKIS